MTNGANLARNRDASPEGMAFEWRETIGFVYRWALGGNPDLKQQGLAFIPIFGLLMMEPNATGSKNDGPVSQGADAGGQSQDSQFLDPRFPAGSRIVVAMSGGVDSSAAAVLLQEAGYDVVGVTLKLYDASGTEKSAGGRCCSPKDIDDARAVAAKFGFPHYVMEESEAFDKAVIDDFISEYRSGRTPNPCVKCNEHIKFGPLVKFAKAIGGAALATGHYAKVLPGASPESGARVMRAADPKKDQSYFLFGVPTALFDQVIFPLGGLVKDQVRDHARRLGVPKCRETRLAAAVFHPRRGPPRVPREKGRGGHCRQHCR